MADPIIIYTECGKCWGDGQFPNPYLDFYGNLTEPESTIDCPKCGGTGRIATQFISSDVQTQLDDMQSTINDIMDKCNDIFEEVTS